MHSGIIFKYTCNQMNALILHSINFSNGSDAGCVFTACCAKDTADDLTRTDSGYANDRGWYTEGADSNERTQSPKHDGDEINEDQH